ncbi:MAG: alanine--tRNA ligase, partial [Balneolaceae bacterium]
IRNEFLEFFREKEHLIVDGAPVVPKDDPTLLFTNAGMNQFKAIFLDEEEGLHESDKLWKRAVDTQRCIRVSGKHNDLEEVGHDTYHHTLFEMLGNWSFGDYFKEEAIEWAWELLVDRWGLDPDRLYATVFEGDESEGLPVDQESIDLWKKKTAISSDHILKFGKKDNFWEMGETGPCGPCSEIHIDLRSDEERKKEPGSKLVNMDDPRVMEIWNLVFIQFNRLADGSLEKLPAQHVDTGMGFERICAVIQGKTSNYDTDIFQTIIDEIASLCNKQYGEDDSTDVAMRVIADHIRAVSFSIADGASPSNEGRGYVIRRILRRAVRYGWDRLGLKKPFMNRLVSVLSDQFKEVFPVLEAQKEYVQSVILAEEKSFLKTLGQGIELFNEMIDGSDRLSDKDAFKLHDTYGFPIDLTELMAKEKGIDVDVEGFDQLMDDQKKRARAAGKFAARESSSIEWIKVTDGD